jgi:hypothetical protein
LASKCGFTEAIFSPLSVVNRASLWLKLLHSKLSRHAKNVVIAVVIVAHVATANRVVREGHVSPANRVVKAGHVSPARPARKPVVNRVREGHVSPASQVPRRQDSRVVVNRVVREGHVSPANRVVKVGHVSHAPSSLVVNPQRGHGRVVKVHNVSPASPASSLRPKYLRAAKILPLRWK